MPDFITLAAAREHLRVGSEVSDAAISSLISDATDIVAERMERPVIGEGGWADGEVPGSVRRAVMAVMVTLYDNPGAPIIDDAMLLGMVGYHCKPSMG